MAETDDFDATTDAESISSIPKEELVDGGGIGNCPKCGTAYEINPRTGKKWCPEYRSHPRPGGRGQVDYPEDPEGIPEFSSTDEPPRKRRGRPPGSKNKAKGGTKLPIPPTAIKALGGAPYMLVGQLYATRTGRTLDFTSPEQVRQMYEASLLALEQWLAEAGVEAPAWLVYAGTTAMCIGAAISIDQIKLKMENELKASSAVKQSVTASQQASAASAVNTAAVAKQPSPAQNPGNAGAVPVGAGAPIALVTLNDSDKRASP